MFRRRKKWEYIPIRPWGLSQVELDRLATYNSEVARGIVHTEEWKEKMAKLQFVFDQERIQELIDGTTD